MFRLVCIFAEELKLPEGPCDVISGRFLWSWKN